MGRSSCHILSLLIKLCDHGHAVDVFCASVTLSVDDINYMTKLIEVFCEY